MSLLSSHSITEKLTDQTGNDPPPKAISNDVTTSNEQSGNDTGGDSATYHPREDREVAEISGDNAQAIFPPNACVFVAK